MKLQKINGKYIKPGIKLKSHVPVLVWAPVLLVLCSAVVYGVLLTIQTLDGPLPELSPARKHSFKVVAVGDIACAPGEANFNDGAGISGACQQKAVGKAVENERADAVLLLGDIQYTSGLAADFNSSFVPYWRGITSPIYVAAGNHDYGNGARSPSLDGYRLAFDTYFPRATYQKEGNTYYDFNIGPWDVYALDSNCAYVGGCGKDSPQLNWLTSKVDTHTAKCSIAMWHHPVFTSGIHRVSPDITYGRDFWRVLDEAGTDIVLNGHDHDYERFRVQDVEGVASLDGIREFVSGAGGYSLRSEVEPYAMGSEKRIDNQFGYLVLELFPGRYIWQFKNVDGTVLDSGSDVCR